MSSTDLSDERTPRSSGGELGDIAGARGEGGHGELLSVRSEHVETTGCLAAITVNPKDKAANEADCLAATTPIVGK
jgi:hypothetical protein